MPEPEISQLLADWVNRDPSARDRLVVVTYDELRRLARHYLRAERADHTLQPTALINEMYMRLAGLDRMRWRDRKHFFAMTAILMRRVLVDYARERGRDKRGSGISITSLDGHDAIDPASTVDVVALDAALAKLGELDAR